MSGMVITLKTKLFRGDFDQARSQYSLLWFMEALCRVNQSHIRQFNHLYKDGAIPHPYPRAYKSGCHYERERGTEEWLDIPTVMEGGSYAGEFPGPWGDCEDWSCWRVAELREMPWHYEISLVGGKRAEIDPAFGKPPGAVRVPGGIKAKPFAKFKQKDDGSYAYHALVLLPDGRLEDPSLTMGMTWEQEFHRRGIAKKYKTGELPINVRFAEVPETVVVDPESPTGYSSSIERAKIYTGLRNGGLSGNYIPETYLKAWPRVGFRSGRLGRLGRQGRPDSNWARRFNHLSINISEPKL